MSEITGGTNMRRLTGIQKKLNKSIKIIKELLLDIQRESRTVKPEGTSIGDINLVYWSDCGKELSPIPLGWIEMKGQLVSIKEYPELFRYLKNSINSSLFPEDGKGNFKMPMYYSDGGMGIMYAGKLKEPT